MPLPDSMPPALREVEGQLGFQQRLWRMERIGWVAMALLVTAALAGLTGAGGPLSRGRAAAPDGSLALDWPRLQRDGAAAEFLLVLPPGGAESALRLGAGFLAAWRVEEIQPPPREVEAAPDGTRLTFRRTPGVPLRIRLRTRAEGGPGLHRAEVAVEPGGAPLAFSAWVWP
jgi:hypothetical protein